VNTFSELLTEYIRRAGISDSELARSIGVSRQTIFRWREGTTSRPQEREIIAPLAEKLRLSGEEKDNLLLAAGFRPETPQVSRDKNVKEPDDIPDVITVADSETHAGDVAVSKNSVVPEKRKRKLRLIIPLVAVPTVALSVWAVAANLFNPANDSPPTTPVSQTTTTNTPTGAAQSITPAAAGEILIVIATTSDTQSVVDFNADLKDAIEREARNNRLSGVRVSLYPNILAGPTEAANISNYSKSSMLVYGKLDSNFTVHFLPGLVNSSNFVTVKSGDNFSELSRALALIILGKVHIDFGDKTQAFGFLTQARNTLSNMNSGGELMSIVDTLLLQTN